jgi:hypothetical protein
MPSYEGFLGRAPDGGARMFLRDDVQEFVDFEPASVRAAECLEGAGAPMAVYRVEVDSEAARPGRLDPQDFSSLFDRESAEESADTALQGAARLADMDRIGTYLVCDPGSRVETPKSVDCETGFNYCYTRLYC